MSNGRDTVDPRNLAAEEEAGPMASCGRQNAHAVIGERIGQLRREADELETLLDALPAKLPPDADLALWGLVINK